MSRTRTVEIKKLDEPWSIITLADGNTLRSRMIVTGVRAVLDDKGDQSIAPDGKPMYQVDMQQVMAIETRQLDA